MSFPSSGVWEGALSHVVRGGVGAPDLQPPQSRCREVPLHSATGDHVFSGNHGDVAVFCKRWVHLLSIVNAPCSSACLQLPIIHNSFPKASRKSLLWVPNHKQVTESIMCFQQTMLETRELSTTCSSSWTWLLVSTLNSSKCSSSRVKTLQCGWSCFPVQYGGL